MNNRRRCSRWCITNCIISRAHNSRALATNFLFWFWFKGGAELFISLSLFIVVMLVVGRRALLSIHAFTYSFHAPVSMFIGASVLNILNTSKVKCVAHWSTLSHSLRTIIITIKPVPPDIGRTQNDWWLFKEMLIVIMNVHTKNRQMI